MVTDRTPQDTELNPRDDAAIREYLEREDLTREERAFFNGLSTEGQLEFLSDLPDKYPPDKNPRILGRKP